MVRAATLCQLLLHLLLRLLQLLFRQRLRLRLVFIDSVVLVAFAPARSRRFLASLWAAVHALLEMLGTRCVLKALFANCLERHWILLVLGRREEIFRCFDILVDRLGMSTSCERSVRRCVRDTAGNRLLGNALRDTSKETTIPYYGLGELT
eukprot:6177739-Pleurochrysis_carterae.AAC.2